MSNRHLVRLIVCGSIDRQDDAAAVWAVETLLEQWPQLRGYVELIRSEQLEVEHLLPGIHGQPVVIADAAVGPPPGAVVVRALTDLAEGKSDALPSSSHALPVGHVLGIAAALGADLRQVTFVGLAGARFGYGRQLSPAVHDALPAYVSELNQTISAMLRAVTTGSNSDVS